MEEYAKKAKITLPSKGCFVLNKWKLLMLLATIMYIIALFAPWIWEHYRLPLMWSKFQHEGWFWSFLAVLRTTRSDYRILIFWDYWFNVTDTVYHRRLSGWLGVFIFQILTIIMALITIHQKNRDKWLSTVITAVLSIIAPILCIHHYVSINGFYDRHIMWGNSRFFIGFWLAAVSSILFFVSCWFAKNAK